MQTTHKIPGSSATSYAEYLTSTSNRADYYTSDGKLDPNLEVPSKWHGSKEVLKDLGLSHERTVTTRHLVTAMNGFNPRTKEPLRPAGSNGERVAGIELMMAPPKTVSATWATASTERREQIEGAHRKAVKAALERTEREVALVRRKSKGVVRFEKAKSLLASELVHTSSRLAKDQERGGIPDPQLHSHVILVAAERQDGKLAAIESKQLYRSARENGAWYRAELAANLQELGLQIERRTGNGERYFEIDGVPEDLASYWSKRAEDVHRAANLFRQRYGREPRAGELGSLTTKTRGSKSAASNLDINNGWRSFGAEKGLSQEQNDELFQKRAIDTRPDVDLAEELLNEVTSERSMIDDHELKAKAYELSAGVCRPADADRLVAELVTTGELLKLEDATWTTRQLRELEEQTIAIAEQRATEIAAPVGEQSLKQARLEIRRTIKATLAQEQRNALHTITGPGGIAVLVGPAGTGKGVVISTAARAWQLEGFEVIGTSVAGATAQRLKADAGLDHAYTADQLIYGIKQGRIQVGPNTVVVFDEAAMADHKRLAPLIKLTAERGGKTLLVGDAAQISPIGPGGLFPALEGKVPTAELHEVHRANHAWERKAWQQVRAGEPGPALAEYRAHDRLHVTDTRAEAAEAMVENWDQIRRTMPDGQAVMITDASNLERDQMNAMAQERRVRAGELGSRQVDLPGKPYSLRVGDNLIFSAKYKIPGEHRIENGTTGKVIDSRDDTKLTIQTHGPESREVDLDASEFSDLSLSYAVHVNKSQGMTAETSGILMGGWQTDKERAYVAVSRAREQTQIYVSREDLGEEGFDTGAMERLAEKIKRSRAQEATTTKRLVQYRPDARHHSNDQPGHAKHSTHAMPERILDRSQPKPSPQASPQHEPPAHSEIRETIKARRERQFEWQRAIDVDLAGEVKKQAQEVEAIEHLAEQLRLEGASEATITQVIATQTAGRDATLERNTQAQREHERYIDHVLKQQRQQLLDEHQQHTNQDRDVDSDPYADQPDEPTRDPYSAHAIQEARDAHQDPQPQQESQHEPAQLEPNDPSIDQANHNGRDPYIQQALQEAREQQESWERGIDPDRENDRAYGIE